jgi:hypothetical protein
VLIEGNGHVSYTGKSYVLTVGMREKAIPKQAVNELLSAFEKRQFFNLKYSYDQHVTDLASTNLYLRVGERVHHVQNSWDGVRTAPDGDEVADLQVHENLDDLARLIDAAVGVEDWIGTEDERNERFEGKPAGYPGAR